MAWEIVIGIETHAQLLTKSKMFSGASTAFGAAPNTQASAVDIALPGVLPVANKGAVELAIRFGLAVGGEISRRSVFARKNYFYPDLPKGYQISQYELPIVKGGSVSFSLDDKILSVRLTRAHLEEDAGKSIHGGFDEAGFDEAPFGGFATEGNWTGIDLNRAGTPLLEIVSEPELRGAKEAVAYAKKLHEIVTSRGICDGNMQEGSFRCDANVSVRKKGDTKLGTRCEIKNLNSFRFMEQAIEFEAKRQIELLEDGKSVSQETRLYDPDRDETRAMRSKEDAQDYRYFPDPDLLPLFVSDADIEKVRKEMPRSLDEIREDLFTLYALASANVTVITATGSLAVFSSQALAGASKETAAVIGNLIAGPISARMNQDRVQDPATRISAANLRALAEMVISKKISSSAANQVLPTMWETNRSPEKIVEEKNLSQISDAGAIEKIVDEVLAANEKQVADYRAGKDKAFNALVGQVMKRTQGKANPAQVNEILRGKLKS